MRTNIYKLLTLALILMFSASCVLHKKTENEVNSVIEDAEELKEKAEIPTKTIPDDVIRVKDDIWLGNTSEVEFEGEAIPAYLETSEGITLISSRPLTLYEIGDTLTKFTSIKVRYDQDLEEQALSAAADNVPNLENIGADWTEPTKMIVSYKGPLSGLLDEVAARFGIWWKYDKKELFFYKHITKVFTLYSLPTNSSLSASVGGSSTEGGGAGSNSISLSNSAQIEMWGNIETTLRAMVASDAQLTVDSANGTISATATPNDIKKISKFINEQNARLSRQVAITVKVLQLTVSDAETFNFDWQTIFKKASDKTISFSTKALTEDAPTISSVSNSGLNMALVTGGRWDISTLLDTLSTQGKASLVTSGTVTTLNNKPAPIQVVKTQNYVSEITKTNSGSSESYDISVDTEEVETGFTLNVLPRILEHGRLLVMFNMTLSDLIKLERVEQGNGSYVQNPIVESRGFSQEVAMKSGQTLILSGYERDKDSVDNTGKITPDNILLGGAKEASQEKNMIIIMLTPVVLETPLDPETRINE